jgi:diadenosine tetraphosphate (Ap4A) HIT family hydrolase
MSRWTNANEWADLVSGARCPVCRDGGPRDALLDLEVTTLSVPGDGPMHGYCVLMLRRHAVELHDLSEGEGAALMRDVQRVSRAVQRLTGAVKMNYEVHGNTVPHLHVHLFPRYPGDPFEGGPVDPHAVAAPAYAPGQAETFRARLRATLAEPAG